MARTVSAPSQSTVHLADKTPWDLYYECLDEGEARRFSIPNLLYKIDMQARYAAARATVLKYTLPVPMVQSRDSFTWSIYSRHLFPNDLSRMILKMNNVDGLFYHNMTEFLQTDIDRSVDFLMNAITIQSLEKYLKTFICLHWTLIKYLPFVIKFFVIQKQWSLLLNKYGYLQGKQQLFLFQSTRQFSSAFYRI